MSPTLWLILPCYNEQEVLDRTIELLSHKLKEMIKHHLISSDSRVVFVDDGSTDSTWNTIQERCKIDQMFDGIKLSRNFGQQHALMAGMMYAHGKCDCIISVDADLQHDINVLPDFIEKYKHGYRVVYGVRTSRSTDSWFKRTTATLFYKVMNCMGTPIADNHSEYRLLSDEALHALQAYKDSNVFLRYIVPRLGFDGATVHYDTKRREAGATKYSVWKMMRLALDAIISSQMHRHRNHRR